MLDELKKIYEENINWLNYAELKNGALITLTGVVFGVVNDSIHVAVFKNLLTVLCILAIMISGISFIPFLNSKAFIKKICRKHYSKKGYYKSDISKNVIFYVSIFLSTKREYEQALLEIMPQADGYSFSDLELNYIEQIYQISTIASIKYYFFTYAATILAIMLILFGVVTIMG